MRALVVGGAACVWDDLAALGTWDGLLICVNDVGAAYPGRVDHWVSLHANKFPVWKRQRATNGGNMDFVTWSQPGAKSRYTDRWLGGWRYGSSSFLAVGVAFDVGATEVVLCGVPMQAEHAHFFDAKPWDQVDRYTKAWVDSLHLIRGRVFSMSGYTRELLGPPPWIIEQEAAA